MPSFVIKNLPDDLHQRLKKQASRHHRSMTREVVAILSKSLSQSEVQDVPAPYRGKFPLTDEFIDQAKHEGRE